MSLNILNSNKKSSTGAKILPQFSISSGNKPLLDLLEIQRKSFFDFLQHGIPDELAKIAVFRETAKNSTCKQELELKFNPETYKFISPNFTPKEAILNGKTYACKVYVQATLMIRSPYPLAISPSELSTNPVASQALQRIRAKQRGGKASTETPAAAQALQRIRAKQRRGKANTETPVPFQRILVASPCRGMRQTLQRSTSMRERVQRILVASPCRGMRQTLPRIPLWGKASMRGGVQRILAERGGGNATTSSVKQKASKTPASFTPSLLRTYAWEGRSNAYVKDPRLAKRVNGGGSDVVSTYAQRSWTPSEYGGFNAYPDRGKLGGKGKLLVRVSKKSIKRKGFEETYPMEWGSGSAASKAQNIQIFRPWIFLGELPLMTKRGHFILNGSPRVIVNQIARCPGIYFQEKRRGVGIEQEIRVSADLIPQRGPWLRIQSDWEGRFWARLKQEGRVKYATLYEAFQEFEKEYNPPLICLLSNSYSINTTSSLFSKAENITFQERKIKEDRQKKALIRLFKNSSRYSLGKLGRSRVNERIHSLFAEWNSGSVKQEVTAANFVGSSEALGRSPFRVLALPLPRSASMRERVPYASEVAHSSTLSGQRIVKDPTSPNAYVVAKRRTLPRSASMCGGVQRIPQGGNATTSTWNGEGGKLREHSVSSELLAKLRGIDISLTEGFKETYHINIMGRRSWHKESTRNLSTSPINPSISSVLYNGAMGKIPFCKHFFNEELMAKDLDAIHTCLERLLEGQGFTDDIDNLKNRFIRTSGKLLQQQFELGLFRLNEVIMPLLGNLLPDYPRAARKTPNASCFNRTSESAAAESKHSTNKKIKGRTPSTNASDPHPSPVPLQRIPRRGKASTETPAATQAHIAERGGVRGTETPAAAQALQRPKGYWTTLNSTEGGLKGLAQQRLRYKDTPCSKVSLAQQQLSHPLPLQDTNLFASWSVQSEENDGIRNAVSTPTEERSVGAKRVIVMESCTGVDRKTVDHTLPYSVESNRLVNKEWSGRAKTLTPLLSQPTRYAPFFEGPEKVLHVGAEPERVIKNAPFRWLRTSKPINSAFREFFGSNPLSQYMDQTNPLAEITHKRRLSSMGPGGIKRETAGMEVRGIHPTHYGRVCPIETPEGKNAGLVNSPTVYGRVGNYGFLETPLYQVIENQVQTKRWTFFSAHHEEKQNNSLATCDTGLLRFNFLAHVPIPVQTANNPLTHFQQVERHRVGYRALSPLQTISIATALIPFLEHDDANRALMGSNMQRQAIPLLLPERPIVGTGFEPLVVIESGQALQAMRIGCVSQADANSIIVHTRYSMEKSFPQNVLQDSKGIWSRALIHRFGLMKWRSKHVANTNSMKQEPPSPDSIGLPRSSSSLPLPPSLPLSLLSPFNASLVSTYALNPPYVRSKEGVQLRYPTLPYFRRFLFHTTNGVSGVSKKFTRWGFTTPREVNSSAGLPLHLLRKPYEVSSIALPGSEQQQLNYRVNKEHLSYSHNTFLLQPLKQDLQFYERSNQETCLNQRPLVQEGDWIQKGDFLADSSASHSGDLALGKNVTVAYMPWEGYNFEDAIVISDRLVSDDVYTSLHIERYEIKVSKNSQGKERITNRVPGTSHSLKHLDNFGIARISSWVQPGDILVGKVVELKRPLFPYERLAWELASRLSPKSPEREKWLNKVWLEDISLRLPPGVCGRVINSQIISTEYTSMSEKEMDSYPQEVHIYLAVKRKIQIGDKLAGRHGNKGIVSAILPQEDMPYLGDGSCIDMVLNPLGVPSRMNLGQIFECLLGLAGSQLGCNFRITPFDEIAGGEASRSLVFLKLYQCRLMYKQQWLFTPTFPGKSKLFDGRTGEPFENWVTVGQAYMLKLIHMVDHKIHARSTGPYSLFTRQPVRGRSRRGGQRLGEMEVWAVEGFGAAYTLQEFLTIKSDDLKARTALQKGFYKQNDVTFGKIHIAPGNPEAFKVLLSELQALCLHIQM